MFSRSRTACPLELAGTRKKPLGDGLGFRAAHMTDAALGTRG